MKFGDYPKAGSLDGVTGFRNYVQSLGIDMPCDDIVAHGPKSPLAAPMEVDGMKIGHRLAIQPMEGWDCERDGKPSDNTKFESIIAYNHPLLDRKFGYPPDRPPISDEEIKRLIDEYIVAARRA